jgi:pilus assembly protein FimV
MALGFGFNKAKVLSAAEKYVQQGKFNNALTEYEKVVRQDPKDLTALNTAGDLYARLGRTDQAIQCFRRVGEAYAADGFTVKAIAMYKKVTKLSPNSTDCIRKLAELYSQQGLNNDARVQYLQVADHFLRINDYEQASRTFEKLLDLDPENSTMQSRLAELYIKLGRTVEARAIYFRAAETHARQGAREAAEQALEHTLKIDPQFGSALIMRARVLHEAGRYQEAVQYLERVTDLDTQPEALRTLLRAHIALKNLTEAVPLAGKLVTVHNDVTGVTACADAMIRSGECEAALRLYAQHADRLLARNTRGLVEALHGTIEDVKKNAPALDILRSLYEKAGENTHLNEVNELLAHALVQTGELARARDLYKQLADVEPDNPVHLQNYKQVRVRMGDPILLRPVPADQADEAFMVDELESSLEVETRYPREVMEAVKSAITDSELLDSYNLAKKALAPLEAVLPEAALHPMLNQRLASLYAREQRFSEAARCCDVLRAVYWDAGHTDHALRYADMAAKYRERIGETAPEFNLEEILGARERHFPAAEETTETFTAPEEVDISHEWETLLVSPAKRMPDMHADSDVEAAVDSLMQATAQPRVVVPAPARQPVDVQAMPAAEPAAVAASSAAAPAASEKAEGTSRFISSDDALAGHLSATADLVEEIRFYISQEMVEEAEAAIERCAAMAPELTDLDDLRREISALKAQPTIVAEVPPEAMPGRAVHSNAASYAPASAVSATDPLLAHEPVLEVPVLRATPEAAPCADPLDELVFDFEHSGKTNFAVPAASPPKVDSEPASVIPKMAMAAASTSVHSARQPAPIASPPVMSPPQTADIMGGNGANPEGASLLADLFEEFKEEVEHESHAEQDDPETHYNLAVAFREMGLLDEAIGEFQKVCQSIESGHAFPRVIESYTWLAQCLVDKGVPQAAIKWYERALRVSGITNDATLAVHYDMGCAFQAAGNNTAALAHFMEVYGTNIDYRDIAERIKSLQQS